jgi:hypothetical protein
VSGLRVRTVLVVGPACLVLLAACGSGTTTAPSTQTVTVTPEIGGAASDAPGETAPSATPQGKVFDTAAVQDSVKKIVTDDYRVAGVKDVTCPAKQEVKEGNTFDCAVSVGDAVKKVTVTVTDADGGYKVSAPA